MIWLFHAFKTCRSCASYHAGLLLRLELAWDSREEGGGKAGSFGTDLSGSGVTPRWISNRADGKQGKARVAMLMEPNHKTDLC